MYGDFVASIRRHRQLTQAQLAAMSGIEQANISAIERGHRVPSTATLHRLVHACGFELTATAGASVIGCPPPLEDDVLDALATPSPFDEPAIVDHSTPMQTRVDVLTAVLDATEAVVRAR